LRRPLASRKVVLQSACHFQTRWGLWNFVSASEPWVAYHCLSADPRCRPIVVIQHILFCRLSEGTQASMHTCGQDQSLAKLGHAADPAYNSRQYLPGRNPMAHHNARPMLAKGWEPWTVHMWARLMGNSSGRTCWAAWALEQLWARLSAPPFSPAP
jgi:hypothetical protein